LFRKLVAKDKEELGITRPSDDFLPHGTLITVQRTRLLEVKDISLQLTCSRCEKQAIYDLIGRFLSLLELVSDKRLNMGLKREQIATHLL